MFSNIHKAIKPSDTKVSRVTLSIYYALTVTGVTKFAAVWLQFSKNIFTEIAVSPMLHLCRRIS